MPMLLPSSIMTTAAAAAARRFSSQSRVFQYGCTQLAQDRVRVMAMTNANSTFHCFSTQATVKATEKAPKKTAKKSAADATSDSAASYLEQKKQAKEIRRQRHEYSVLRKQRLKTRRSGPGKVKNRMKKEFRSWFIPYLVNDEYMERKARQAGLAWNIHVAVLLERSMVIWPDKEDWLIEFENLTTHLGQWGKEYPKELYKGKDLNKKPPMTDEDLMKLLPKGYVPAPRITEADLNGNVRTLDRQLKESVYLYLQSEDDTWQFPTVAVQEDETLLEAAKRAVKDLVGEQVSYWPSSNAPGAVFMTPYPVEERTNGFYGIKTFFMRLQHDGGIVEESRLKAKDYAWLSRAELVDRATQNTGILPPQFYRYVLM
jgi:large subunit ribosomal protein L46